MKQPKAKKNAGDGADTQAGKAKPSAKKPEAFDLWLNRGLHRIYDDVASEPIPDELLKLIEDDRKK